MISHVLLVLCGMSPAVITETIWALRNDLPDKIVVITTLQGAACIRHELFDSGIWEEFKRRFYPSKSVYFGDNASSIRLIPQQSWTKDAEDIQSSGDNEEFADFLLDQLRQFTENSDVRLTFSISGGRKTMSALGALCLSLLGRQEDTMCHVLVSPPFDRNDLQPRFYFPTHHDCYFLPDGSSHYDNEAAITFCEIPYVHQRYLFGERVTQVGSYRNLVTSANGLLGASNAERLVISPRQLQLKIGRKQVTLPFREFILYYFLVLHHRNHRAPLTGTTALYEEFYDAVRSWPADGVSSKFAERHSEIIEKMNTLQADDLRKVISSITRHFRKAQIPTNSGAYPSAKRGEYGLTIAEAMIHVEEC